MAVFLKKYLSKEPLALAAEYARLEALKDKLEGQRPQVYERVLDLQEGELSEKSNPQALQSAQALLVDVDQKLSACARAMVRYRDQLKSSLRVECDNLLKKLPKFKAELQGRQSLTAQRAGLAAKVLEFWQGNDLGQLAAHRADLAELSKHLAAVEKNPESYDFRELAALVSFLQNTWADDPFGKKEIKSQANPAGEWKPGDEARRVQERQGHLQKFVAELIADAREES
jgi:hypothetical protein